MSSLRYYPDPDYRALREALGTFHGVDPDWIFPGNGAAEILTWIGRALAEQSAQFNSRIHLVTPAFGDYRRSLQACHAAIVEHPLQLDSLFTLSSNGDDDHGIAARRGTTLLSVLANNDYRESSENRSSHSAGERTTQRLRSALVFGSNDALLLNNPHNPSGILFSAESIEPFCQSMRRVVIDEAFMDFLRPPHQSSLIAQLETWPNLIIVRSLTKFYSLPGLRIGYAIAHPDHIKRWKEWRDPWPVNTLAEAAAIASLADDDFQERTWRWLETARPQLIQGLSRIPGLRVLQGTANFLLVQTVCSVTALQRWLLTEHRILIRDCISFPELGDRYFRIAVRTQAENERVLNAISAGMAVLTDSANR